MSVDELRSKGVDVFVLKKKLERRNSMNVRCKMKCTEVTNFEGGHRKVVFAAVCADEVPENQRYHKYTPNGRIELTITNPNVSYDVGAFYYFDSTPVPAAA